MKKGVYKVDKEELNKPVPGCTLGVDGKNRNVHLCYMADCKHCGWYAEERKRRKMLLRTEGLQEKSYGGIRFLALVSAD